MQMMCTALSLVGCLSPIHGNQPMIWVAILHVTMLGILNCQSCVHTGAGFEPL